MTPNENLPPQPDDQSQGVLNNASSDESGLDASKYTGPASKSSAQLPTDAAGAPVAHDNYRYDKDEATLMKPTSRDDEHIVDGRTNTLRDAGAPDDNDRKNPGPENDSL